MYSRIQGLEASNSFAIHRHGLVGVKRVPTEIKESSLRPSYKTCAVKADSAVPEAMIHSPHPDAVRRRREAEERRIQRAAALEATLAATQGRSINIDSPNLYDIADPSDLRYRLTMGSRSGNLVVAHFKAAWCSACARMQYKVGQIAEQNPDVTFLIIDISKNPDLLEAATELGVQDLPSFLFFKDGEFLSQIKCNLSKINILRAEIAGHKNFTGEAREKEPCTPINA